jgi:uncharacterized protein (DUF58 family)
MASKPIKSSASFSRRSPGRNEPPVIAQPAPVLDPALLGRISDLELVARILAEGLVSGLHRSPFHGYSAEFSQYRQYRPGDDLKYVDWKLVARTDRLYTKQFRETTNLAAMMVVDTSASMAFPEGPTAKFRYAVVAAAALAHLISHQGDTVGLMTDGTLLPPKAGRQHLRRLLASLSGLSAGLSWSSAAVVRRAAERLGRRGLLLVFSDFYDDEDATFAELRRAARLGHEVVVFQVISREEIDFGYHREVEFVDLESGRTLAVDAKAARRQYMDRMAAFLERCRLRAGAEGFQYSLTLTDTPHDRSLRTFLLARR